MSESNPNPNPQPESITRPVGGTEHSWCRAVPGGTGITVLALLLSRPLNISLLQNALDNLQISHPLLRSKIHFDSTTETFSFVTPQTPHVKIQPFDLSSTAEILRTIDNPGFHPYHMLLEHELNSNAWKDPDRWIDSESGVFHVSLYALTGEEFSLVLRLHTAVCDRAAAVALLTDLLEEVVAGGGGDKKSAGAEMEIGKLREGSLGIEEMIPAGKANKPFWARGVDMLGYSLNAFRLAHLSFIDAESPRRSQVVRLKMTGDETEKLVAGCKARDVKLCAALAAAALLAARSSKDLPIDHIEKYAVVTLMDCRPILDPVLKSNNLGFYHSAIMNTHDITGGETLWDLAKRCYDSFSNAKNSNKHFTDMADLNFLMCKAIENPQLTPSSSHRTGLISVFEDPVVEESNEVMNREIGLEDCVGCSSVHGVGPSIAVFDTIRDGRLDCACVYPWPLHSREQMQGLVDDMKKILVDGSSLVNTKG